MDRYLACYQPTMMRVIPVLGLHKLYVWSLNLELMTLSSDIVSAHTLCFAAHASGSLVHGKSTGAQTGANRDDGTDRTRTHM
jgi:hypothetical protein